MGWATWIDQRAAIGQDRQARREHIGESIGKGGGRVAVVEWRATATSGLLLFVGRRAGVGHC